MKARGWLDRLRNKYPWVLDRWVLVGTAGIVAVALGLIGYTDWLTSLHHHDPVNIPAPGPFDVIFDSFALFVLGAAQGTGMPILLEIARLLAPFAVGLAALIALYGVSRDRLLQMWIPRKHGHVVVCGLGQVGSELLHRLREENHLRKEKLRAVVIEADATNPNIELCRSMRIPVIVGDAQRKQTLRSAGVQRAARLLAVVSSDAVNAEIVAVAQELAITEAGAGLRCLARVADPELCALLRIQEANVTSDPRSSALDFFNLDDISARAWLEKFPIEPSHGEPHVLVSTLDGLGTSLVILAAARWYADRTDGARLWITVVDDHAEERINALLDQYPGVEPACRFIYCSTSVPYLRGLAARLKEAGAPPLVRAYVTANSDERALETALGLHHHFDRKAPLVVEMWQTSGVGRLISKSHTGGRTHIEMFPSLEAACTAELLRGGTFQYYEAIAIAIHEHWRAQQSGEPAPAWDELDESRKESNRAQARDIPVKLQSIGCEIAMIDDPQRTTFPGFTAEDIERLARDEHKRWIRERIEDGWQQATDQETKDVATKKTKYLLPFDELSEDVQDFDRNAVRSIPAVLNSTGQCVVLAKTAERGAAAPTARV